MGKAPQQVVIDLPVMEAFLDEETMSDLIALYSFYCHEALCQGTSMIQATLDYIHAELGWRRQRIQKTRNKLLEMGLVGRDVKRDPLNTKIKRHYTIVFLCENNGSNGTSSQRQKEFFYITSGGRGFRGIGGVQGGERGQGARGGLNIQLPKVSDPRWLKQQGLDYLPMARKLAGIVKANIGKKTISKKTLTQWAVHFRRLHETDKVSIDRIEIILEWFTKFFGMDYVPDVQSGRSFRKKFVNLENAKRREDGRQSRTKDKRTDPTDDEDGVGYQRGGRGW